MFCDSEARVVDFFFPFLFILDTARPQGALEPTRTAFAQGARHFDSASQWFRKPTMFAFRTRHDLVLATGTETPYTVTSGAFVLIDFGRCIGQTKSPVE